MRLERVANSVVSRVEARDKARGGYVFLHPSKRECAQTNRKLKASTSGATLGSFLRAHIRHELFAEQFDDGIGGNGARAHNANRALF